MVSRARAITSDGLRRTEFRIMWPLSETAIPLLTAPDAPLHESVGKVVLCQTEFLRFWFTFLQAGCASEAKQALANWNHLMSCPDLKEQLATLLVCDDEVSRTEALDKVADATSRIGSYLVRRVGAEAFARWNKGCANDAFELLGSILESGIDIEVQVRGLDPILEIGEGLAREVQSAAIAIPDFGISDRPVLPRCVIDLDRLSNLLTDRHPLAGSWANAVHEWNVAFVLKVRASVVKMHALEQHDEALTLVGHALDLVTDPEAKAELEDDLSALQQHLVNKANSKYYREILPIERTPVLRTVNGIGVRPYRSNLFLPDRSKSFAVLFFTVFFVPIFPLGRYLVQTEPEELWHFYGKTRWTVWMKAYSLISLGAILILVFISGRDSTPYTQVMTDAPTIPSTSPLTQPEAPSKPRSSEGARTSPTAANVASRSDADGTANNLSGDTASTMSQELGALMKKNEETYNERFFLESQANDVRGELTGLDAEIDADSAAIARERAALSDAKTKIDSMNPDLSSQEATASYDSLVLDYYEGRKSFNAHVQRHNDMVKLEQKKVRRFNRLVDEIGKLYQ